MSISRYGNSNPKLKDIAEIATSVRDQSMKLPDMNTNYKNHALYVYEMAMAIEEAYDLRQEKHSPSSFLSDYYDYLLKYQSEVERIEKMNWFSRVWNIRKNNNKMIELKEELNSIMNKFTLENLINSRMDASKVERLKKLQKQIMELKKRMALWDAIYDNKIDNIKAILEEATKDEIQLKINEKDVKGNTPLLKFIYDNSTDKVKMLIDYALKNRIILNLNDQDQDKVYCLFRVIDKKNDDLLQLILDYANNNYVLLHIHEKDKQERSLLYQAIDKNQLKIVHQLLNYADSHDLLFNVNEKTKEGRTLLFPLLHKNNRQMFQVITTYAKDHQMVLSLNEKDQNQVSPLLYAVDQNQIEMVHLLLEYAERNQVLLNMNDSDSSGNYPLLTAILHNYREMIQLLMNYAITHHFDLNLNEANNSGEYPFLSAVTHHNVEMVNLIIDYAQDQHLLLNLNKTNYKRENPLLIAVAQGYDVICKLILDYGTKNGLILSLNEDDLEDRMRRNNHSSNSPTQSVEEIHDSIIKLLSVCQRENKIKISFKDGESPLFLRLSKVSPFTRNFNTSYNNHNHNHNHNRDQNHNNNDDDVSSEITRAIENLAISFLSNLFNNNSSTSSSTPATTSSTPATAARTEETTTRNINVTPFSSPNHQNPTGDLAIANFDFTGNTSEELSIRKNEYLIITNWNSKEGWAYGYKRDDSYQQGLVPKVLVMKCDSNDSNEDENTMGHLPTYDEIYNNPSTSSFPPQQQQQHLYPTAPSPEDTYFYHN